MHNTGALSNLQTLAHALGGEVSGGQVLAPGPGHSATDRSLSIKLDSNAPDGFFVHSLPTTILSCVAITSARRLDFQPSGQMVAAINAYRTTLSSGPSWRLRQAQSRNDKPKGRIVATYDYTDADGKLLYQVVRYEPKDFRQRRPDGNGGWTGSSMSGVSCIAGPNY